MGVGVAVHTFLCECVVCVTCDATSCNAFCMYVQQMYYHTHTHTLTHTHTRIQLRMLQLFCSVSLRRKEVDKLQ